MSTTRRTQFDTLTLF